VTLALVNGSSAETDQTTWRRTGPHALRTCRRPEGRSRRARRAWAEDNRVAVVEELLAQLQQLAEDDLGVAAVHEVWEQITNYER
jgi:hypothetical protein